MGKIADFEVMPPVVAGNLGQASFTVSLPICAQMTYLRSHVVYLPASLKECEKPIHCFMPRPAVIVRDNLDGQMVETIT